MSSSQNNNDKGHGGGASRGPPPPQGPSGGSGGGSVPLPDRASITCSRCGGTDHAAFICVNPLKCQVCGAEGIHPSHQCPQLQVAEKFLAAAAAAAERKRKEEEVERERRRVEHFRLEKERLRRVPRPGGSNPPASAPTGPSVFGAGATVFPPFRANPSPRRGLPAVGPRTVLTVEQWRRWEHEEAEKEKKRKRDEEEKEERAKKQKVEKEEKEKAKEKERRKGKRAGQRKKREDWQRNEDAAFAERHAAWQRGELPKKLREEKERREADNASHEEAVRAARRSAFEEGFRERALWERMGLEDRPTWNVNEHLDGLVRAFDAQAVNPLRSPILRGQEPTPHQNPHEDPGTSEDGD